MLQSQHCSLTPVAKTAHKAEENVESELHTDTDCQDEDDSGDGAEFDAEDAESPEELTDNAGDDEDDEGGGPGRHQEDADDEEDSCQGRGQSQQQVEAEADVLLPECEGDTEGEVGETPGLEAVADIPHFLNCGHHGSGVAQVIQQEWDLSVLNRLRFRNDQVTVPRVVIPFLGNWLQTGLAVAVSHGVIAVPGGQIIVKASRVDDLVFHQSCGSQENFVHWIVHMSGLYEQFVGEGQS